MQNSHICNTEVLPIAVENEEQHLQQYAAYKSRSVIRATYLCMSNLCVRPHPTSLRARYRKGFS